MKSSHLATFNMQELFGFAVFQGDLWGHWYRDREHEYSFTVHDLKLFTSVIFYSWVSYSAWLVSFFLTVWPPQGSCSENYRGSNRNPFQCMAFSGKTFVINAYSAVSWGWLVRIRGGHAVRSLVSLHSPPWAPRSFSLSSGSRILCLYSVEQCRGSP